MLFCASVLPIFLPSFLHVTLAGGRPPVLLHDNVTFSPSSAVTGLGVTATVGLAEIYHYISFIINRFLLLVK